MSDKKIILAAGLNPAWQKTLVFEELRPGAVNRAAAVFHKAAGKAVNFARAAGIFGGAAKVFQVTGGDTGRSVCLALEDEGIEHTGTADDSAPTRCCVTCLCRKTGSMTELIEPSAELSPGTVAELKKRIEEELSGVSALALCGTYPPGVGPDFYTGAAERAVSLKIPVLIDVCADLGGPLGAGADYLKVNKSEILSMTGKTDTLPAMRALMKKYPLKALAVTDGPEKAFLAAGAKIWEYTIPLLKDVKNPLGAGDTASAVFLASLLRGGSPEDAFAGALAAASASCLTLECAVFSTETAKKILAQISRRAV